MTTTKADASADASPVERIGRYEVYSEIASGGMASVCFGRQIGHVGFARTVAIKRLHPHVARDPDFVQMFLDEARLATRIQNAHVVQTLDVVASGGELLLVMDYVHGEALSKLLTTTAQRGERIDARIAVAIASGVLEGLHAAHEARSERGQPLEIVHRDISPQNVLVGLDGVSRVFDFGIAKAADRIHTTQDGSLKGKLAYMSPEQLENQNVDRRTDVWAASVVLWEMLAGRRLFTADSQAALVRVVLTRDVPSLTTFGLPKPLDAVLTRGLARDPAQRYSTAREMLFALEQALPGAPARQVGLWVERHASAELGGRARMLEQVGDRAAKDRPSGATKVELAAHLADEAPATSPEPQSNEEDDRDTNDNRNDDAFVPEDATPRMPNPFRAALREQQLREQQQTGPQPAFASLPLPKPPPRSPSSTPMLRTPRQRPPSVSPIGGSGAVRAPAIVADDDNVTIARPAPSEVRTHDNHGQSAAAAAVAASVAADVIEGEATSPWVGRGSDPHAADSTLPSQEDELDNTVARPLSDPLALQATRQMPVPPSSNPMMPPSSNPMMPPSSNRQAATMPASFFGRPSAGEELIPPRLRWAALFSGVALGACVFVLATVLLRRHPSSERTIPSSTVAVQPTAPIPTTPIAPTFVPTAIATPTTTTLVAPASSVIGASDPTPAATQPAPAPTSPPATTRRPGGGSHPPQKPPPSTPSAAPRKCTQFDFDYPACLKR